MGWEGRGAQSCTKSPWRILTHSNQLPRLQGTAKRRALLWPEELHNHPKPRDDTTPGWRQTRGAGRETKPSHGRQGGLCACSAAALAASFPNWGKVRIQHCGHTPNPFLSLGNTNQGNDTMLQLLCQQMCARAGETEKQGHLCRRPGLGSSGLGQNKPVVNCLQFRESRGGGCSSAHSGFPSSPFTQK